MRRLLLFVGTPLILFGFVEYPGNRAVAASPAKSTSVAGGERRASPTAPGKFSWQFRKDEILRYDLTQRVQVKSSNPSDTERPPMIVEGSIVITPRDENAARMDFKAKRNLPRPQPPRPAPPVEQPAPEPTGPSCGCLRSKPAPPPVPKPAPPQFPAPAGPPFVMATFQLDRAGTIEGDQRSAGGQTELLTKALLPLPREPLTLGESETTGVGVDPVGGRFPLEGKRMIKYERDEDVDGHKCAVLRSQLELKGLAPTGAGTEGTMELKSETTAHFDIEAGRFVRSQSRTWFQMNTAQVKDGRPKAVTVEQEMETTLRLRDLAPASAPAATPAP